MRKRHFIVHNTDGAYTLKEIHADIAEGMNRYGVTTTDYHCVDANMCWYFYFVQATAFNENQRHLILHQLVTQVEAFPVE